MQIVLLVDRYLPHPLSSAQMIHDLAAELLRLGNYVTVVTSDDSLSRNVDISDEQGVTVVRVKAGKIRHPSKIIRAINEARLPSVIWRAAGDYFRAHPCDLVVSYSPTIFWSDLVNKLKALKQGRSYLVLRDLFPQWAVDAGLIRRHGPAFWYLRRQELKLYQSSDVIGVQSRANLDYFSSLGLAGKYRLEVLFNWTTLNQSPVRDSGLRARLGLQDKVIFVFGGNVGVAQDVDNILRLAASLKEEERIYFLLVGAGTEYDRIAREIERGAMDNIKLLPAVSHRDYLAILAECDVGLITLRRDLKTQNFPGKMLTYMEQRKPMLASINPGNDLREVLQEYGAGLVCTNGEDESFRGMAVTLAYDASLRAQMGTNAYRLLSERFNVRTAARQIVGVSSVEAGRRNDRGAGN